MQPKIAGILPSCGCAKPARLAELAAGSGFPSPSDPAVQWGQDLLSLTGVLFPKHWCHTAAFLRVNACQKVVAFSVVAEWSAW